MAEWKRKLYEKILILYPVFVGVWGDKPVIFLYSSIFLYPMLYSCRNSFGKWNFFVIFLIYIPKKKSLILFKAFVTVSITILHTGTLFAKNRTDSQNVFWEWCSKNAGEAGCIGAFCCPSEQPSWFFTPFCQMKPIVSPRERHCSRHRTFGEKWVRRSSV